MSENKIPKVAEVPSEENFAIHLANMFMEEENFQVEVQEDESVLDVILSVPEANREFSIWLVKIIYNNTFSETESPPKTLLN